MERRVVVRDDFDNIVYEDVIDYTSEEDLEEINALADKLGCHVFLMSV